MGHIRAGKLRALCVTGAQKYELLPEPPTCQSDSPGLVAVNWWGVLMPAGTPRPIVQKLNAEFIRAMNVPEVRKVIESSGYLVVGSTPAELDAHLRAEIARWGTVVKAAGVTVQ